MPSASIEQKRASDRRYYQRKMGKLPPLPTVEQKFWARVIKTESCWLWQGRLERDGYGKIWAQGKNHPVHRFSFTLHGGVIPLGTQLDHLCRIRDCVNPAHLEPVTIKENVLRGEGITATQARMTECGRGHEFNTINTYITSAGHRVCRICRRVNAKNYKLRVKDYNALLKTKPKGKQ